MEEASLAERKAKARKYLAAKKNQKVRDKKIYSLGGEIFSSVTHGVAAFVAIALMILCIVVAVKNGFGWLAIVSISVFGIAAAAGFTISCVYHGLAINLGKRVMRILDYCSIYFIIAGTYTPFCLIALEGWVGWTLFGVNWTLCIIGTTLSAIDRKKFKKFSFICYLTMGWIAVVAIVPIIQSIGWGLSFWMLLGGGVAYTIGAMIFKLKGKYTHGVWHLFTLLGLGLHFLSIYFLLV